MYDYIDTNFENLPLLGEGFDLFEQAEYLTMLVGMFFIKTNYPDINKSISDIPFFEMLSSKSPRIKQSDYSYENATHACRRMETIAGKYGYELVIDTHEMVMINIDGSQNKEYRYLISDLAKFDHVINLKKDELVKVVDDKTLIKPRCKLAYLIHKYTDENVDTVSFKLDVNTGFKNIDATALMLYLTCYKEFDCLKEIKIYLPEFDFENEFKYLYSNIERKLYDLIPFEFAMADLFVLEDLVTALKPSDLVSAYGVYSGTIFSRSELNTIDCIKPDFDTFSKTCMVDIPSESLPTVDF